MKPINKLKWKFRQLYQRLFYWLEWRLSDERHDPWRCEECGSTDVEIKVWIKPNEGGRPNCDCEEFDRSYCNTCNENVRVRPTSALLNYAEDWWAGTDFPQMERITGYRQDDFSPEEGYQEFVDACNKWWEALSIEEKICLWLND